MTDPETAREDAKTVESCTRCGVPLAPDRYFPAGCAVPVK